MSEPVSRTEFTYDSRRNPICETASPRVRARGRHRTVRTLTEYSVRQSGRLDCSRSPDEPGRVRLAGTPARRRRQGDAARTGSRRNVYDAAGQRVQLREGVGSRPMKAAEATWAYNLNGQVTTVIDGNGNRAELRYDGHLRQDRWTFPSTTRPAAYNDATQATALASAGSVNAADYEDYGYDAAGNRTHLAQARRLDARLHLRQPQPDDRQDRARAAQALTAAQTRDVYYGYDLRNLQLFARFDSAAGEGVTNGYDGFGRLTSSSINHGRGHAGRSPINTTAAAAAPGSPIPDGGWFDGLWL